MATVRWMRRRTDDDEKMASAYVAVWADDRRTTRLIIHNYWTEAYRIAGSLDIAVSLIDADGRAVAERSITLDENATAVIDVRTWLAEAGVSLPFSGQAELIVEHDELVPRRPLQALAEYLDDDGGASSVHGQFGISDRPLAQIVGAMRVAPGAEGRTFVTPMNAYVDVDMTASLRVEVANAQGEVIEATIENLPNRASRQIALDELLPGLDFHLGDESGHVAIEYPYPASRTLTYIEHPDGARLANHGTIDRRFDQAAGVAAEWTRSRPIVSVPVFAGPRRDTIVTLPNVWGPTNTTYIATFRLYDADGQYLNTHRQPVPAGGLRRVSMNRVMHGVDHLSATEPTVTHAEIWVEPLDEVSEVPATVDVLVGIVDDDTTVTEIQVGSAFFNAEIPPDLADPDIRRTRTFGHVSLGTDVRSWLFLAHPIGDDSEREPATATIRLVSQSGDVERSVEVTIPARGFFFSSVADVFPDATDWLGPDGLAVVKVRSTDARLYGYYFIERDGAPTHAGCHLLGG